MLWQCGWLAGCHTPVLYQNGKPILKLFQSSGSPIILVSSDHFADTQFQGCRHKGSAGALNTQVWEKLAIFDGNRHFRLSRKWCEIGRWLLLNVIYIGSHGCRFEWYHF